ncbi:hypothetical protein K3495_g13202 [Podosphaera aphanis]|nr:hypothetical protein K3495_g13202 [Podosphaera aphanis]
MNTKKWTKIREELPPAPKGWDQMLRHQFSVEFQKAAEKELQILEEKKTWTCTREDEVPESCKIAGLCARGDLLGSEEDPYAATLASQTFRAMMAITAAHDLEIRQYDVVNAIVNAPIRGEVYYHAPKGYDSKFQGKPMVLKLLKALYGFKFSPLYWYDEFLAFLLNHGFHQVPGVDCMATNQYVNLIFFVDDIMITFNESDTSQADNFDHDLATVFEVRRITKTCSFLGIRIVRDRPARKL